MNLIASLMISVLLALPLCGAANDASAKGGRRVSGYTRRNGTYVRSHRRTRANRTQRNNWSTRGNRNPYTGKRGYKRARW